MDSPAVVVIYASISDIPQPSYAPGGKEIVGIQCAGRGLANRHDSFTKVTCSGTKPTVVRVPLDTFPLYSIQYRIATGTHHRN